VTTRLIGRLEITYTDDSVDTIVSDRTWQTAPGPSVTSMWYSGTDYDARREQPGWDAPGANLSATATRRDGSLTGWIAAGIAPAPNLATRLIWHQGDPVKIVKTFTPVSVTQPVTGTWVFDFGQNFAGWPELRLSPWEGTVLAGTVIRMLPAESLSANGTVTQGSLGPSGGRGTSLFNAYITYGNPAGETWRPQFQYFGMQYVQVTGLPAGYTPTVDTITGLQLRGANEQIGSVTTSDARINRIHQMALYSFMSNMMAQFTDCPGREKQSYPADYMIESTR
jgi:alpha-L-rhamnosidase